ncbi:MAG: MmgE/PrpD family protein [Chloroflexi bacterium]|nr:MmgE/PrpD family protein [Chloroflexota bacterium]
MTATTEGLTRTVCEYVAASRYDDLPADVVEVAKRLTLDSLGTTLAGGTLGDGGPETAAVVLSSGGNPESTVLGYDKKVSAVMAGLANGAMVHALNYDAIGAEGGHPGAFALTAPLAIAERRGGMSGKDFINALVVGVEVEMRSVIALLRAGVNTKGRFLEGQLLSYVGATLSAGRALELSADQLDSALGLMLMQSSGSRQVVVYGDPPAKGIYAAFPNQGGVLAALLAQEGLGAHCDALEGQAGVFAMFYNGVYDASIITEGLGTTYYTLDSSFKPWPTSGLIHAFIEAGLQLRNDDGIDPDVVVELRLTGHPDSRNWFEPVEERQRPGSAASAANSVYFGAAKALANGAVTLSDFTPEGLGQPEALQLTAKGSHELDASLSPHAGIVEVVLRSGATAARRVALPLGHPARPLSREQLVDKFMDCASHAPLPLSEGALESVVDLIDRLEELDDVTAIPEALSRR